jgi:hypothetical protein
VNQEYTAHICSLLKKQKTVYLTSTTQSIPILAVVVDNVQAQYCNGAERKTAFNNPKDPVLGTKFTLKAYSDFSLKMVATLNLKSE